MNVRRRFAIYLPDMRRPAMRASVVVLASAGLAGCLSPAKPYLDMGRRLSDAGFVAHKADTTARYAMMNTLPPGDLTYRPSTVGPIYLYADPIGCGCVYMGSATAYSSYMSVVDAKKKPPQAVPGVAELPAMAAENRRDTALWDWSAWSPNADPGPTQPRHVIGGYW